MAYRISTGGQFVPQWKSIENKKAAKHGGKIAGDARRELEKKTNKRVVSVSNYLPEKKQKKIE